jgi:hypothetical protein
MTSHPSPNEAVAWLRGELASGPRWTRELRRDCVFGDEDLAKAALALNVRTAKEGPRMMWALPTISSPSAATQKGPTMATHATAPAARRPRVSPGEMRTRIAMIVNSDSARGREVLALELALRTGTSIDEAVAVLRAAPAEPDRMADGSKRDSAADVYSRMRTQRETTSNDSNDQQGAGTTAADIYRRREVQAGHRQR